MAFIKEISEDQLEHLLSGLVKAKKSRDPINVTEPMLLDAFERWENKTEFKPGDIVKYKTGFSTARQPESLGVVLEVFEQPINSGEDLNQADAAEPLDILIGTYASDGRFRTWPFNSRRFELVEVNLDD